MSAKLLPQVLLDRAKASVYTFEIPGAPRTKKNHGRHLKRGNRIFAVPSAAFEQWQNDAAYFINKAKTYYAKGTFPSTFRVNCRAIFYRHADVGDAAGFYQALADALEKHGILKDDKQIVQWDGSRLLKDADNPRVHVTLEVL